MGVGTYCLITSENARMATGNNSEANALWIYCSQADATGATCTVNDLTLVLVITGGAQAGTNTITFSGAANDTLTELVGVINALTGWKAGLMYYAASPSTNLIVTGAQSCLGAANELTLKTTTTHETDLLADRATSFIEAYCGRKFLTRSYNRVQFRGNGRNKLVLSQYPVTRIFRVTSGKTNAFSVTNTTATTFATVEVNATQIRLNADGTVTNITLATPATINALIVLINAVTGWSATLISGGTTKPTYTGSDGTTAVSNIFPMPAADCKSTSVAYVEIPQSEVSGYCLINGGGDEDRDAGMIYMSGGWAQGELFCVDFVAGMSTIAPALEECCILLVKYAWDQKSVSSGLSSENLGDYGWSRRDLKSALPDELMAELNMFRAYEF
jgi:hypothetical protein